MSLASFPHDPDCPCSRCESRRIKPIIVLAGNYHEYLRHIQEHPDQKFIRGEWPNMLAWEASGFIEIGTFSSRDDAYSLRTFAKSRIR